MWEYKVVKLSQTEFNSLQKELMDEEKERFNKENEGRSNVRSNNAPLPKMRKISFGQAEYLEIKLNEYSDEGWELDTIKETGSFSGYIVFKRKME